MPVSPMYPGPWQGHKSDSSRQDPPRGIQLTVGQDIQKHTETAASAAWSNHVAAKWNRDSSGLKEMMTITCGHLLWPITARAINKYTGQSVISVIKLQTVQGITCSASAHTMLPVGSHVITSCQAETHKALKWCPWVLHLQWLSLTLVFCELCISLSRWWIPDAWGYKPLIAATMCGRWGLQNSVQRCLNTMLPFTGDIGSQLLTLQTFPAFGNSKVAPNKHVQSIEMIHVETNVLSTWNHT